MALLNPVQFERARSVEARYTLPTAQTSLIGREFAVATIRDLLSEVCLLTITGAGGSGKTRLALRVAEDALATASGGVCWVDLAPLSDPALVPQAVARALRLHEQSHHAFAELIIEHLRDRAVLLVLDNCEHLREACADLLTTLFRAGTRARVLVTSREPLSVQGERVWPVPMLTMPGAHAVLPMTELLQFEAVRLFYERAKTIAPAFTLSEQNIEAVAEIARQLDGMPLAIELAAARVNVLTPNQIVARLGDSVRLLTRGVHSDALGGHARHKTLAAALDWSFDLLSPAEQALFIRLAVFAGSFHLDAVEGICAGQGLAQDDLLDLLANLVEKSLVVASDQKGEMRYHLLVPIRHYAARRLCTTGTEAHWRARHAAWYLALAQDAEPHLEGPKQAFWFDRLESEHDNLRAALVWYAADNRSARDGEPGIEDPSPAAHHAPLAGQDGDENVEAGLRLSGALCRFWIIRGYPGEGRRWLDAFLEKAADGGGVAPEVEVDATNALARLVVQQSNFLAARAYYERSLALARQVEYEEGIETASVWLGIVQWDLGDFEAARTQLEESVRYIRHTQHGHALARGLNLLGLVCMHQGEGKIARVYLDESLAINQRLGNKAGIATVLYNLAMLAEQGGDFARARLLYEETLLINRELGNRSTIADVLNNLGATAIALGDSPKAFPYFDEAEYLYREIGALGDTAYVGANRGDAAFYSGDYGAAQKHYQTALALFREAGNQRLIARSLGMLGRIACRAGDLAAAATLSAEALNLRRAMGHKAGMIFALDKEYVELALAAGQPAVAARLLGAVEAARRTFSRPREPVETRQLEPVLASLQAQLGDATPAMAEGETMTLEQAASYAFDTLSLATVTQPRPEVRIFALGPLRIYRGDRLLTSADWTYDKARELVLYLLCRPNVSREQIGLHFWPDASDQQVRKRFSAALTHARSALGRTTPGITLTDGHYRIDPARVYSFDVEVFESRLRAAHLLLRNHDAQSAFDEQTRLECIRLLDEAIHLYRGDFAEDLLEGEWYQSRRAALLHVYLEALLTLGKIHTEVGQYDQAIAVYRRALAKDPYLEEAHHELICCYAQLRKRGQALRQYDILTAAMAELDAVPSSETQAIIERLQHDIPL